MVSVCALLVSFTCRDPHGNYSYELRGSITDGLKNWYDAELDCVSDGGHLVSVHNDYANQIIWDYHGGDDCWIGLKDSLGVG